MGKSFVVIDDAAFLRELYKNILSEKGFLFLAEAADGEEGVRVTQAHLPDLVVIDLVMPKLNGIQAIREIRSFGHDIKILVCSTLDDEMIIDQAKEAGANEYLVKPFSRDGFIQTLNRMFQNEGELNGGT